MILFNPLKHHLLSMQEFIRIRRLEGAHSIGSELIVLGSSQMDVYMGDLSVDQILQEIEQYMSRHGFTDRSTFHEYLGSHGDYTHTELSDGSGWILRETESEDQFAHIHPARYSRLSRRIKAGILKTSIAVSILQPGNMEPGSENINAIRENVLQLPPLRSVDHTGLTELLQLLEPEGH